ncbi:MAG: ferrous iron transport protein B [Bacteriovoracaceae bacterium]
MIPRVALVGMPNVGKTALFNKLTGSFQKVANFPGITVEKKIGWITEQNQKLVELIDLPGLYSLDATTLDEKVTKDFLLKKEKEASAELFVLVLDATNLDKSLFLAFQLKQIGYPLLIALNLIDEARKREFSIDIEKFKAALNAEIIPVSGATGEGIAELKKKIIEKFNSEQRINLVLPENPQKEFRSPIYVSSIFKQVDLLLKEITLSPLKADSFSEKVDRWVLHPIWGIVILFTLLLLMFQMLFSWATPLQDLIEAAFSFLGTLASNHISNELFKSFIVDGIISGVGGVIVFLPQILILFLFIQFLEDLGYLGRAAFLMDSFMRRIGLPGKAVIPLLSSHACAIPGVLSTRIIDNHRERLITTLVIPLTTCSARLPVYTILIAAIIPNVSVWGIPWLKAPGLALFALYMLGFVSALIVAFVLKKTLPQSSPSMLLMELPPYRIPKLKNLLLVLNNNAKIFLQKAGGFILLVSIIIWVLITFPQENGVSHIEQSYAAMIGRVFEPLFSPLGFDWRMMTALIPSIGAREVVVSALSLVLSVQADADPTQMSQALLNNFSMGSLIALLVWYVFAPQCISTFAVIKRETNSLKWPLLMLGYTLTLAYFFAWLARITFS